MSGCVETINYRSVPAYQEGRDAFVSLLGRGFAAAEIACQHKSQVDFNTSVNRTAWWTGYLDERTLAKFGW